MELNKEYFKQSSQRQKLSGKKAKLNYMLPTLNFNPLNLLKVRGWKIRDTLAIITRKLK